MTDRMYRGKRPRTEGWEHIASIEDDVRWLVFVKDNPDNEWLTVKVVADGRVPFKANYWLGWNGKRFAQVQDTFAIMQRRPELLKVVERLIDGYSLL
jgi:hypothetical protein